jgi:thiol-disulfide isomerase/thioredoxin
MKVVIPRSMIVCLLAAAVAQWVSPSWAGPPTVEQALKLTPIQPGVDYTRPTPPEAAKCTISVRKFDGKVGWVVEDANGLILRKFLDTNGDNVVDQWSYYKDGVEVYRDIDSDFNGKADQYRWFHTGGTRRGLDKNEDGKIDAWKAISAEELSAEVVAALAEHNANRFALVTLTPEELKSLGLGKETAERLAGRISGLVSEFKALAGRQKVITPDTQWVQFSGGKPGIVPAGTDGSTQDLQVYENVVAIVEAGGKHGQVQIGTLVQTGEGWRVIDLPHPVTEEMAEDSSTGFFFQASMVNRGDSTGSGPSEEAQKLLGDLEALEKTANQATAPEKRIELNERRTDLLEKMVQQTRNPQDRALWVRQLADTIASAVQSGGYPDGARRLEATFEKLRKNEADKDLAAYVRFRQLMAAYALSFQAPKADVAKIQADWLKNLEQYVADYPTAADSAEAMLQLAIAQEYAGQEEQAKSWYSRIVKDFANSPTAQKAAGAQTRLGSVGKVIALSGKGPSGSPVDLAKFRGKVVLIQYWATWCEPAKADMATLKDLLKKYAGSLAVIGVSLDSDPKALGAFLAEARLPWPQIYEEGGLDSRPANQLGIVTLPTMILVDQQGKVVNYNIQIGEIDGEVKKLIR